MCSNLGSQKKETYFDICSFGLKKPNDKICLTFYFAIKETKSFCVLVFSENETKFIFISFGRKTFFFLFHFETRNLKNILHFVLVKVRKLFWIFI